MKDLQEFPLWLTLANWWLQHRLNIRERGKPWCTDKTWLSLLTGLRRTLPVPHTWLEKWVTERMLVWIDGQMGKCTLRMQVAAIQQNIVSMHPDWRSLFKNVPGIQV
jgi:hypothetical protein